MQYSTVGDSPSFPAVLGPSVVPGMILVSHSAPTDCGTPASVANKIIAALLSLNSAGTGVANKSKMLINAMRDVCLSKVN